MLDGDTQDYGGTDTWLAERVIFLALLRDDHDERWTPDELRREVAPLPAQTAREGLIRLEREGVAVRFDAHILASRCARHMDALGLVSV